MIRATDYKLRVLRNGAFYKEADFDTVSPPHIRASRTSELKAALTCSIFPDEGVDLLKDELQPVAVIDGEEKPLGVFRVATLRDKYDGFRTMTSIESYDRTWLCYARTTESLLHLNAGSGYLSSIMTMLNECGISNVISDSSDSVLATDREDWTVGTRYLTIINTLLDEIGFLPLWFDSDGTAHLTAYTSPSGSVIAKHYSSSDIRFTSRAPGFESSTDVFNAPNVFVCICDNADRSAVLTATAVNETYGDKSALRRGMRITSVTKVNNIADQTSLQTYADKLRDDSLFTTQTVKFYVPCEGGRNIGQVITLDDDEISGIYREDSWMLTLSPGQLVELTVSRITV